MSAGVLLFLGMMVTSLAVLVVLRNLTESAVPSSQSRITHHAARITYQADTPIFLQTCSP